MLVEYLFDINPLVMIGIMISIVLLVLKVSKYSSSKQKKERYEEIPVNFKNLNKTTGPQLSVMTYNIMAYNFTKLEWFPNTEPEYLHPKHRSPRIVQEIEDTMPDIINFQECDYDLFQDYYNPMLSWLGYGFIHRVCGGSKQVINVTAYNTSRITAIAKEFLDLNEGLDMIDESFIKHKEAIFVTFKLKKEGNTVVNVNTELYWNPDYEYVRYGQIAQILKHYEAKFSQYPLVICGDFHSLPDSNLLKFIYKVKPSIINMRGDSKVNQKYIDRIFNDMNHKQSLRSAYDQYNSVGNFQENHPAFTTYISDNEGCKDYIIYTDEILQVNKILDVPTENEEIKVCKLPCKTYPSDHLKLFAYFSFKNQN